MRSSKSVNFYRVRTHKTIHSPTEEESIDLDAPIVPCLVGFFTLAIHYSLKECDWLIQIWRLLKELRAEGFPEF